MNAAFLLVATAWFAGDTAVATPVPAASACCGSSSCSEECGSCGHKFCERLRGMFKRKDSCDTCSAPQCPAPAPKCEASCSSCCEKKLFTWHKKHCGDTCASSCAPTCAPACAPAAPVCAPKCAPVCAPTCAPKCAPACAPSCAPACDSCSKPKLLDRLRACFHHEKGCCEGGCSSGTCGGTTVMPQSGEGIPTPPRKMPSPSGKEPPAKEVRIDTPPSLAPIVPGIEIAPNAGQAPPALVPSVDSDNLRNPF